MRASDPAKTSLWVVPLEAADWGSGTGPNRAIELLAHHNSDASARSAANRADRPAALDVTVTVTVTGANPLTHGSLQVMIVRLNGGPDMGRSGVMGGQLGQGHQARLGRQLVGLVATAVVIAGCSSSNSASKLLNPDPPGKMYTQADGFLARGRYETAAHKFEDLDRDHPYAPEARRAIVMAAFAYFKAGKFAEAIATAKRYTTMHPGTKEAPLAHHIIAMSHFSEMRSPNRDQSSTRKALEEFKRLVERYPDSSYARSAPNKIRICEDSLAAHEMQVGHQYLKGGKLLAAKNRFEVVAREFQTTAHVEEALMRLVEINLALGIVHEAQTAAAVLGHNFPNSDWYKDAYRKLAAGGHQPQNHGSTWLSRAFSSVKLPQL